MKIVLSMARAIRLFTLAAALFTGTTSLHAQAVTAIVTDYRGSWKSTASAPNPVFPDNSHNLLSFTYNGIQYSTGVDDARLTSLGETFRACDFWSLPVTNMSGSVNGNTKVGLGAMYDGVYNGPSNPAPENGIFMYLTDGVKGLNLGTCIANLPAGTMHFSLNNIQASAIGDGVPDILVTQIADPSGSTDRYEFVNAEGVRVGNYLDIIFTNIPPVGTWVADFYSPGSPMTLQSGFTQTTRPLRLWAADLSEFGITAANYTQIRNFRINLCGNSDVAFVAYNNRSMNFQAPLPVRFTNVSAKRMSSQAQVSWQTANEVNVAEYIVERSVNGGMFEAVGRVPAGRLASQRYSLIDPRAPVQTVLYRVRYADVNGGGGLSPVIRLDGEGMVRPVSCYPNPARTTAWLHHDEANGRGRIRVYNAAGIQVKEVGAAGTRTELPVGSLSKGSYRVVWTDGVATSSSVLVVQ